MRVLSRCLAVWLIAVLNPTLGHADAVPKSVLILNEAGPEIQGYLETAASLRSALKSNSPASTVVYIESLDLNRFRGPQYQKTLLNFVREKYFDRPIGIIVALGTEALRFALQLRTDGRWSETAIVFALVDQQRATSLLPKANVTGKFLKFSVSNSIIAARALVRDLKQVAIVGDPLERQAFRGHFAVELPEATADLELINLLGAPLSDVRERVAAMPEKSAILYTSITSDGAGNQYLPNEALEIVAKSANRPIVIDVDNRLGHGGSGGFVVLPVLVGEETANLVLRLFGGENASQIPISNSRALKPVFDWRELQRWGVDETNLPPGSEIRFRAPTAWEQYRWQIIFLASIILSQAALISGLLYEHRRRRRAELESFRRMAELAHLNRIATGGALSASIAHEVKQPLAAMVAQSGAAIRWLGQKTPNIDEARAALQKIVVAGNRASQIVENLRSMFRKDPGQRRPLKVNDILKNVLGLTAREMEKHNIYVQTGFFSALEPRTMGDQAQLEQVFLNLVMNAVEAMSCSTDGARVLQVNTGVSEIDGVLISIADSGPGIDAGNLDKMFEAFFTTKPNGMGMGLSICRSIIESHGGRLWATRKDRGLIFYISLPVAR